MRMWTDLRKLGRAFADLPAEVAEDEQASFELVRSAHRFSSAAKEKVEDKLSFSAVLMRAGEADAATRLIEELERDVRAEEAALIEQMNEVRIARSMRRDRITRARLARVLVTAIVGAGMMAFSAIGMAVAGMVADEDRVSPSTPGLAANAARGAGRAAHDQVVADRLRRKMKKVKIADAEVLLSREQLRMLEKITTGTAGGSAVEQLIRQLQLPPDLAAEVRKVLNAASTVAAEAPPAPEVEVPQTETSPSPKKKSKKKSQPKEEQPADPQEPETPTTSADEDDDSDEGGDSNGEEKKDGATPQLPSLP